MAAADDSPAVCWFLYSSTPTNASVESMQSRVRGILAALKVKTADVDGANAENKTQRSEFWAISGKRAVYPQVFVQAKGETKFVGDGEDIVLANDDGILEGQLADAPRVEADA
ncbi:hypothetical protein FNF29_05935 [Cafeteria roenbergensis]|uniref:Uncharacterized protein n=1 Tax=Cafeteria roenbergensis TaxID=33653 RepID=A0A5A8CAD7_CAFRO|nr:hypothetical protein FNF29_05935 [Cafeteria roenbergensis]|eukprot:KAA0149549.1 hypothetical protein FNF29_05935 [Cafeteria roenbergensis]